MCVAFMTLINTNTGTLVQRTRVDVIGCDGNKKIRVAVRDNHHNMSCIFICDSDFMEILIPYVTH